MSAAIDRALSDLDAARDACIAALEDRFAMPADKVRAASELRHLAKQRLELLDRQADDEAERRDRAQAGVW